MKRTFLILLLAVASVFAAGQGSVSAWQSFGGAMGESPEVTVLESDQNHVLLEVTIPGFWLYDKPAEGIVWNYVELPGCNPQGRVGLPDLPSVVEMFALPYGTEAIVTVEEVNSTTYENMEILPRQTPEIDMEHAPYPFVISEEFYHGGESYPSAPVEIDNEGIWAGLNVARLVVNPFSYNPSTGSMEVVSSITLRVDFEGNAAQLADPVISSMALEMERIVLNWDVFEASATSSGGTRDDGVEYVFVCTENTVDWVTELFETHHYLGLHVRVEVLPASGATTSDVKTAITDNYTTGVTRFACIVGSHSDLPSYNYGSYYGDYYYACITGGDDLPEIAVGRLTGNQAQIELQVDKIIDGYMEYSFDDANTTGIAPSEAVLAAHQEQYPGKYTQCCNEIAAETYGLCDMTFIKVYPPEGGTAAMVSNAINNGVGTVTYRGHGDVTYWTWSPGWNASNINALTNTFMPPVFNMACLCGEYVPGGTCLAEAWAWATNGASGNLSAYDPSYTIPNHDHIKQIYIALYDTGLFRVGEAHNAGAAFIVNNHGSIGVTNAKMYLWFGDPAMDVWTFDTASEPGELLIAAPATVAPGTQNISITVTDAGVPVAGVNVTLTDGIDMTDAMTCYEEGTTNASGIATINVTVPASGVMHVGAFLHDYQYDMDDITITGTGVAGSEGPTGALSLDRPYPNPITENASLGFNVPFSGNVEISVYDVSGRMVETILSGSVESGSHSLTWAPGSEIASGVYFIRLTTDEGILTQQAMVIR
ncbi:MAG: T9SS type A sorting domain-containing protein [Candidatus Aegiribacteria sp.]|nr:T9SS type A sorting domain-containing protein [Candidatus Aegiribacteria sp.]